MTQVKFYDSVDDSLLKFAVIITKSEGNWVLCKHKERTTYEVPGATEKKGNPLKRPQDGNFTRKREQRSIRLSRFLYIP